MNYLDWEFPECNFKYGSKNEYVCIKDVSAGIQAALIIGKDYSPDDISAIKVVSG